MGVNDTVNIHTNQLYGNPGDIEWVYRDALKARTQKEANEALRGIFDAMGYDLYDGEIDKAVRENIAILASLHGQELRLIMETLYGGKHPIAGSARNEWHSIEWFFQDFAYRVGFYHLRCVL